MVRRPLPRAQAVARRRESDVRGRRPPRSAAQGPQRRGTAAENAAGWSPIRRVESGDSAPSPWEGRQSRVPAAGTAVRAEVGPPGTILGLIQPRDQSVAFPLRGRTRMSL